MLLVIFGVVSLQRLSVREYPDIDRPTVSVTTAYRGASAAIIETKITQIIEDSVAGIEGILKLESDSEDERSQVRIEFDVNRDVDAAANDVRDRIARVLRGLPAEADPPQIVKADASADSVVTLAFSSDSMSMLDLTDYAERNIVDRMSTVPGVASVGIVGGRRYSMRIWIDRQSLATRQMTVTDIEDALRRENVELPAGRLESRTREFSLRTMVGLETEQDFRNLVIARGAEGHLVRLGELADVRLAAENERSYSRLNGQPGLMLQVQAQSKGKARDRARRARRGRAHEGQPAGRHDAQRQRRQRAADRGRSPRGPDRRRLRAELGARRHLSVPRQPARHVDSGRDDPGVDHRVADRHVRARLLRERADAARPRARDRPRRRRRDRRARERAPAP
jgi:multidrug efflux pump